LEIRFWSSLKALGAVRETRLTKSSRSIWRRTRSVARTPAMMKTQIMMAMSCCGWNGYQAIASRRRIGP
jgi:hypothetical protein